MIASLPMYDHPGTAAANDRLWALIRARLRAAGLPAPPGLHRGGDPRADWEHPELVLSQTCGLPYRTRLHGRVTLIGTPDHGGRADCPPGRYRSLAVVRAHDPRPDMAAFDGATLAFSERMSHSGWAAAHGHAAAHGIAFGALRATGSHRAAQRAVAAGAADIAFIDAVTWTILHRERAETAGLRVLDRTATAPALPFIAAAGAPRGLLRDALGDAIAALPEDDRHRLVLHGLVDVPADAYLAMPEPASADDGAA